MDPREGVRRWPLARRLRSVRVSLLVSAGLLALLAVVPASGAPGDLRFNSCIEDPTANECSRDFDGLDGVTGLALSPDGRDLYAVSFRRTTAPVGGDDALVQLRRNKRTGRLRGASCIQDPDVPGGPTCARTRDGLDGLIDAAVSPNGRHVYAIAFNDDTLLHFRRNRKNGGLRYVGCLDDADLSPVNDKCPGGVEGMGAPVALALSPDGRSLYVTTSLDDAIVTFRVNRKTGKPRPDGCFEDDDKLFDDCPDREGLGTPEAVAVHPNGRNVYVTSWDDSAITRFRRNRRTGRLSFAGCVQNRGAASDDNCPERAAGIPEPHSLGISPDGRFLYSGTVNDAAMAEFRIRKNGSLRFTRCIEAPFSAQPCATVAQRIGRANSFAFDPRGRSLFVAGGQGVQPFRRNPRNGELTEVPCIEDDDAPAVNYSCQRTSRGLLGALALAMSRDGRFLYVAAGSDDAISVFRHRR